MLLTLVKRETRVMSLFFASTRYRVVKIARSCSDAIL
jgi:hypothetical protein